MFELWQDGKKKHRVEFISSDLWYLQDKKRSQVESVKTAFTVNCTKWTFPSYSSHCYFHCPACNDTNCSLNTSLSLHCLSRKKKMTGSVHLSALSRFAQTSPMIIINWQKIHCDYRNTIPVIKHLLYLEKFWLISALGLHYVSFH